MDVLSCSTPAGRSCLTRTGKRFGHSGYAEVWYGKVEVTGIENAVITGARIELHTDVIARTRSAKEYTSGHRLYGLVEGDLLWAFDMAAVEQPLQSHLSARLKRW
jgi:hypothetical protein